MESVTKNKKSFEDLQNLVSTSMSVPLVSAQELTEGYFNAAYMLELADGRKCVMKIAPLSDENLMSYEKGMMGAEIDAMHLAGTCRNIPVAQVYAADTSRTRCDSPYFIMECLPGESFAQRKKSLSSDTVRKIYIALGEIIKNLHTITSERFGMLAGLFTSDSWFETFYQMMSALIDDARRKNLSLGVEPERLLAYLRTRKPIFDQVACAHLIHWDTWDGNILIQNDEIKGIIDWERALWGDVLMEYNFRTFTWNKDFFEGYGQTGFSPEEKERIEWYDMYLNLILYIEAYYRMYPDRQLSEHAYERFQCIRKEMGL